MDPRENHRKQQVSCLEMHQPTLELVVRITRKGLVGICVLQARRKDWFSSIQLHPNSWRPPD